MVFKLFIAVVAALCVVECALLCLLTNHTSWVTPLLITVITGLLGAAVVCYHGRRIVSLLTIRHCPRSILLDGLIILIGGILLIVPGVISDLAGFFLLFPPVRWLIVAIVRRWDLSHGGAVHQPLGSAAGNPICDDRSCNDPR